MTTNPFKPGDKVRFKTIKEMEEKYQNKLTSRTKKLHEKNQGKIFTVTNIVSYDDHLIKVTPEPKYKVNNGKLSFTRFVKIDNKIQINQKLFIL